MAKLQDKLYNRVIDGNLLLEEGEKSQVVSAVNAGIASGDISTLKMSEIINLGQLMSDGTLAAFNKSITKDEYDAIYASGLAIIMFNTTCQLIPYSKAQANRFVCNSVYDDEGNSMVVRGRLVVYDDELGHYSIIVALDSQYADKVVSLSPKPYGIVRFISL